jgi:bifunctional non-homologous end joining protein LigD
LPSRYRSLALRCRALADPRQLAQAVRAARRDSRYKSGRTDRWRKIKCWTKASSSSSATAIDKKSGAPIALLAEDAPDGLPFAGGAFITLQGRSREVFGKKLARLAADRPPLPSLRRRGAQWVKPEMVVGVRHLRGTGALRHATVRHLRD